MPNNSKTKEQKYFEMVGNVHNNIYCRITFQQSD